MGREWWSGECNRPLRFNRSKEFGQPTMKSLILSRVAIVVVAIFFALMLRLGFKASLSDGLLRILIYAVYLSVLPVISWLMIYGGLSVLQRRQDFVGFALIRHILTDVIFSCCFILIGFYGIYFGPKNSGANVSIYSEGTDKMIDGQFTLAGMEDAIDSLFSMVIALQIMNSLSLIWCLYSTRQNKSRNKPPIAD